MHDEFVTISFVGLLLHELKAVVKTWRLQESKIQDPYMDTRRQGFIDFPSGKISSKHPAVIKETPLSPVRLKLILHLQIDRLSMIQIDLYIQYSFFFFRIFSFFKRISDLRILEAAAITVSIPYHINTFLSLHVTICLQFLAVFHIKQHNPQTIGSTVRGLYDTTLSPILHDLFSRYPCIRLCFND